MTSLAFGALAVVTVVASFAFSLAVLVVTRQAQVGTTRTAPTPAPAEPTAPAASAATEAVAEDTPKSGDGSDDATDPMSRVLRDIERLATLREQGALTEKEFIAQKAKLLVTPASPRARRPQRTS